MSDYDDTWRERKHAATDDGRPAAVEKRHARGFRTARENLDDLCDARSFSEYGELAVAAQRSRRSPDELRESTAADGVITGTATVNAASFGPERSRVAVIINDYTVLAGSQGFFHHRKLDRILGLAGESRLPVIMFTEGGGGRPGDVDVTTQIAGLNVPSFAAWARLSGQVLRVAINNGYCFAGNAALFGSADITIATRASWIGMAGPAMIEGAGLGTFDATDIGPTDVQSANGVLDLVADDEAHATALAKKVLGYFQGDLETWQAADQRLLADCLPENRRMSYRIRSIIDIIADAESFTEIRQNYGSGIVTGFLRMEGKAFGLIANDCRVLAGAIDATAAEKAGRFMQLCNAFDLPILSLCDTPGFMVGPDSEKEASVRRMSRMFVSGANVTVPWICLFLRKGYGLGAMAMAGGSFAAPHYTVSWPQGEFGAMGLEGAVRLGYRQELEAETDEHQRQQLFDTLLSKMYEQGKATEAAAFLEIDAVIDPVDTRAVILRALMSAGARRRSDHKRFIDTW